MSSSTTIRIALIMATVLMSSCKKNPLEKYGVTYQITTGRSPTFVHVQLLRSQNGSEKNGPEIIGSDLAVRFEDLDADGVSDIVVYSESAPSWKTEVKFMPDRLHGADFKILNNNALEINFPEQGYYWP